MKKETKILISLLAAVSLTVSASAAPLLYEDWSGFAVGSNPASSSTWTQIGGAATDLIIVENPNDPGSKILKPNYGEGAALVRISSSEAFSLGDGLRLDFSAALESQGQYFRFGFAPEDNTSRYYFFDIVGNANRTVRMQKVVTGGTVYTLWESKMSTLYPADTFANFSVSMIPVDDTSYRFVGTFNGDVLFDVIDSENVPPYAGKDIVVILGFRNPQQGAVGTISLTAIPEPGTMSLGAGVLAFLAVCLYRRKLRTR